MRISSWEKWWRLEKLEIVCNSGCIRSWIGCIQAWSEICYSLDQGSTLLFVQFHSILSSIQAICHSISQGKAQIQQQQRQRWWLWLEIGRSVAKMQLRHISMQFLLKTYSNFTRQRHPAPFSRAKIWSFLYFSHSIVESLSILGKKIKSFHSIDQREV